ncbi:MAG TPA: hypothetical protein VND65_05560 [Candidatus Binatia bacterium]|nr:hypothetical protein [Candidatus Binatia bacterium]
MNNKVLRVLEFVFGCRHRNLSRPFTLSGWTYEVCLTCGKKSAYTRAAIGCEVRQPRPVVPNYIPWREEPGRVFLLSELQQERAQLS